MDRTGRNRRIGPAALAGGLAGALVMGLALAGAAPVQAQSGPVNAASFLARAKALKARGIAALFSSEMSTLQKLGAAAGAEYRARLAQERAAGKPSSCPPPKVQISSDQFLNHLETYPPAVRERTTLTMAVADLFARNWPCR